MILVHTKSLDIQRIGDTEEGIQAGISDESVPFIFKMVSEQLYSNPIGSIVREITSNCFDAHKEAGNEVDPVIITQGHDAEEGYYIEFKDFGVGISPDRVESIYMNYFSSTKRKDNTQIGGFGIGSKTPLAYTDMFYITTVFNGVKYEFIFHKGETKPMLESLHGWGVESSVKETEEGEVTVQKKVSLGIETEDKNGTTIKISVGQSNSYNSDYTKFKKELGIQLAYFENVYFEGWGISNDYDIYEGKFFKYRSNITATYDYSSPQVHICIGQVRYPINFDKVKVPSHFKAIPIAIKFDIGELPITPSREALQYTDESCLLITERLNKAFVEIEEMFAKENPDVESLEDWVKISNQTPRITFNAEKEHHIKMWEGADFSKTFKFKPLNHLDLKKLPKKFAFMWNTRASIRNGVKLSNVSTTGIDNANLLNRTYLILKREDVTSMYTDLYIQECLGSVTLVKRDSIDFEEVSEKLGIPKKTLGKAKIISEYTKVIDALVVKHSSGYYQDYKPSQEWVNNYKKSILESSAAYQRKLKAKVFHKPANRSFGAVETPAMQFANRTGILVYGFKEDREILSQIYNSLADSVPSFSKYNRKHTSYSDKLSKAFVVTQVARSVEKTINEPKKSIHWEDFLKTKFFRRVYTAHLMEDQLQSTLYSIKAKGDIFNNLFLNVELEAQQIKNFIARFFKSTYHSSFCIKSEALRDVTPIPEMMKLVQDFKKKWDKPVPFIYYIKFSILSSPTDLAYVINTLKTAKVRLDNKWYLKSEDQLIQEAEEQLIYSLTINNIDNGNEKSNQDCESSHTSSFRAICS